MDKVIEFSAFLQNVLGVDKKSLKPIDGSEKSKKFAILFGNGLLISNPKLGGQFDFCYKCIINELFTEFSKFTNSDNIKSLETSITVLKYLLLDILLKKYMDIMKCDISSLKNVNLKNFMKCFNQIFTLNYDPVIYLNIFDEDGSTMFSDGFKGSDKLLIEDIKPVGDCIPFFYLHGALHIVADVKNKRFYKLTKTNERSMLKEIEYKINEIFANWKNKRELEENLTLVFAVKPHYKEAEIIHNPYLKLCLDRLKEVKKLFIFGCSFEFDTHIISALVKNENIQNVFISFLEGSSPTLNSKTNFEKKLKKLVDRGELSADKSQEFENKITWVETSSFADIIWK